MKLQIHGRNLEITAKTREHIEKKLRRLNRHLTGITDATAELAFNATHLNNDRVVAEVTLHLSGSVLRAHSRAANSKVAVNLAVRALDQQIKRYKSHAYRNARSRMRCRQARWRSDLEFRNPREGRKTEEHDAGNKRGVNEPIST